MASTEYFHKINGLKEFLLSIQLLKSADSGFKKVVVSSGKPYRTNDGSFGTTAPQFFWYDETETFTLESARGIVKKALTAEGHKYSDDLANAILLVFAFIPKKKDIISSFREIFENIQCVSLCQYYLIEGAAESDFKGFSFGDFKFGVLDERTFEYRCKKATTDYYELYKDSLKGNISLERDFYDVNIIAWAHFAHVYSIKSSGFQEAVLTCYELLSDLFFDDFWVDFVEQQSLQLAMGIKYIDPEPFKKNISAEKISIFSQIAAFNRLVGYLVPIAQYGRHVTVSVYLDDDIKSLNKKLKDQYRFENFNSSKLHQTIESYVQFIAKARIYLEENRINEAFLNFVIALDLLLGENNMSTKSVSTRAAILTYKSFEVPFSTQKKLLQDIYSIRSKYVHAGFDVPAEILDDTVRVCTSVLIALFEVQASDQALDFNSWIKKLDFAVSGIEAEISVDDAVLTSIGVANRNLNILEH